jgi:hypothetical protein
MPLGNGQYIIVVTLPDYIPQEFDPRELQRYRRKRRFNWRRWSVALCALAVLVGVGWIAWTVFGSGFAWPWEPQQVSPAAQWRLPWEHAQGEPDVFKLPPNPIGDAAQTIYDGAIAMVSLMITAAVAWLLWLFRRPLAALGSVLAKSKGGKSD